MPQKLKSLSLKVPSLKIQSLKVVESTRSIVVSDLVNWSKLEEPTVKKQSEAGFEPEAFGTGVRRLTN